MELLQLKYFCNAAESENFSKTAHKFSVPPSNISQSIKRLERELNKNLFVRNGNKVNLSEEGRAFYEKVSAALSLLENACDELQKKDSKLIRLCVEVNRRIVMETIENYRKLYSEVDIVTKHSAPENTEEYDIIITDKILDIKGKMCERLISEDIKLAVPATSPLANKKEISRNDLENAAFITMNRDSSLYKLTEQICESAGVNPHIAIQSEDPFYIRRCVELGLGIAAVPVFSWKGQFPSNVVLKDIGNITRDTYIYTPNEKYIKPSVKKFAEMLKEASRQN